jgi:hypothetical protein
MIGYIILFIIFIVISGGIYFGIPYIMKKFFSAATLGLIECTKDSDCGKGEKCSGHGGEGFKCQPLSDVGQSCTYTTGCKDGLWCATDSTCENKRNDGEPCPLNNNACISGKCGNGSICLTKDGYIPEGSGGCLHDSDCGPNMKCSGWGGGGVICQKLGKEGDGCTYDDGCEPGLRCRLSTCQKLGKEGEACTYDDGCEPGMRCRNLTCQKLGTVGQACTYDDGCEPGLRCRNLTCQKLGTIGQACTYDDGCEPGLRCRNLTCQKLGTIGQACTYDDGCEPGMRCRNFTCQKLGTIGQACTYDDGCEPGMRCRNFTCQKLGTVGQACTYTSGCEPGLYCASDLKCNFKRKKGAGCFTDSACISNSCTWSTCN